MMKSSATSAAATVPPYVVLPVGPFEANCILVPGEAAGELWVIDPGEEALLILRAAEKFRYSRAAILLTHAHADHIHAVGEMASALDDCPVYLHPADVPLYRSPLNVLLPYYEAAENLPDPRWPLPESAPFQVLACPGHSPGGVAYYLPAQKVCFTGDTLFRGSVGRTDLPGGDAQQLMKSLRETLLRLPDDTVCVPGHGPETSIGFERRSNPSMLGFVKLLT